jgi:hypothetical protein
MSFNRSRALVATMVAALTGLAVAVAIAATGTAYAAGPTYNLQGGWILGTMNAGGTGVTQDANGDTYTITSMDMSSGNFSGTADVQGTAFVVAGNENGSVATYTLSEDGYVATDILNLGVLGDGNVGGSGTFTDNSHTTTPTPFAAELTTPVGGTTTTGTTSTATSTSTTGTTTTTSTSKIPTSTAVQCDYFVASQNDTCTASVGNGDGSITSTPTGAVSFTGDRTGACSLQSTPDSPGVASCSITVPGSESDFLNITATYAGDGNHSGSSGNTAFLTAGPGSTLYNTTIQQFNPQTLQFIEDNPVSGSTLTGLGQFTEDGSSCSATSDAGTSGAPASAARKAKVKVPTLTVKDTVRHAKKGRVKLHLSLNQKQLRKLFPGTHRITLELQVIVKPPHGASTTTMEFESFVLKAPKHGKLHVSKLTLAPSNTPSVKPTFTRTSVERTDEDSGATVFSESGSFVQLCDGLTGTIHLTVTIPGPSDPNRGADTTSSATGSFSFTKCAGLSTQGSGTINANGKGATSSQLVHAGAIFSGAGGNLAGGGSTFAYIVNTASAVIGGNLATGNSTCPSIFLNDTDLNP